VPMRTYQPVEYTRHEPDTRPWLEHVTTRAKSILAPFACCIALLSGMSVPAQQPNSKPHILTWDPPNLDAHLPPDSAPSACPLSTVLSQVGARAVAFSANLSKFTAQENIQYRALGNAYEQESDSGSFDYTAAFDRSKKGYIVQENRLPEKGSHA